MSDKSSEITTESLLKEALAAISAKYCHCRKCRYVWKPKFKAKRDTRHPKKCPACTQPHWEEGWRASPHKDRDPSKLQPHRGGSEAYRKRALRLMREELAERAILLKERERFEREARVRELMRRIDAGLET